MQAISKFVFPARVYLRVARSICFGIRTDRYGIKCTSVLRLLSRRLLPARENTSDADETGKECGLNDGQGNQNCTISTGKEGGFGD